ncbi:hypothetical protein L9F63_000308, partial [Diploptera punctata]
MQIISIFSLIFTGLLLVTYIDENNGENILAIFPVQSKSHMTVNLAVVKELANRGHNVTVVSAFPEKNPHPNYTDIVLKKKAIEELLSDKENGMEFKPFDMLEMSYFQTVNFLWFFGNRICSSVLSEEPVQNLINSGEHFDLIVLETFYVDCFLGFAHIFKAPVVQICTFAGTEEVADLVGNPTPYAYIPDPFQEFDQNMNFMERLKNTWGYTIQKLARKYYIVDQDAIMRKFFNDSSMPYIEELQEHTALVLVNHHFTIGPPRPMVPNYIQVGGMHVKPPKDLPQDLQKYMDEADDGVIYFSMGSNLRSADMPKKTIAALINAFSQLKQKILWKWEEDSLPGQPANLMLGKWLPQSDILAHPNLKLFITHGGLLSTQETIHRGIPVIGIPILGDQMLNMARMESLGIAKILKFTNISEESVVRTMKEVLENPKYRENAQRLSRIYRDQPLTPLEQAVFWTEHMIRSFLLIASIFFTNINDSQEAKILAVFPVPSTSHTYVDFAVVKELANRGHDVTVVSAFPEKNPLPNYRDIAIKKYSFEEIVNMTQNNDDNSQKFDPFEMKASSYFFKIMMLQFFGSKMCNVMLQEEPIQNLMKSKEHFDLIFLESFFTDCFLGFAHVFKAPVVQISTYAGNEELGDLVGNPCPYAYVPNPFQDYNHKMNFEERLFNTFGYLFQKLTRKYFVYQQNSIMREHFHDPNMPSIEELEKSTALVLVNHHFSISSPRPLVPNFVEVGGMHVKPPKKLPADLQQIMDEAKNGAIYFSMGSNLQSANMPKKTVEAFTKAFSKLNQTVLWKWEEESLPGQPANLKLSKWFPQSDILAHPNLKLFITHGGLLSTQETIHRGVPVVGIPILGDQKLNMARTESMGIGKILEFKNISEDSVVWTIKEAFQEQLYRENAQRISEIYRDQPMTPLEQAAFWSEYVIRHKGAPHLRSAALDLTWYQYFLLDVIAVLALAVILILFVVFIIIRAIFRLCFGSSKQTHDLLVLFEEPFKTLLNSQEQFDLIIIENFYMDCFLGFAHKFKAPVVQLCTYGGTEATGEMLDPDLQKYLDEAMDGAVYFSFGSNLNNSQMPKETVNAFIGAFSKLKQKILWKWEENVLPDQPKNVEIRKWLPQSDILAHPNIKLFITHGGLLSIQETIIRGVPIVGIPIFGDQRLNIARSVSSGIGILLEFKNLTEESIISSIKHVIDNPKYRENVRSLSRLFQDRPPAPLEQAVYWTEYVIRHKGAPHMRSAALDLTWYQYFLLDVTAFLVLIMTILTLSVLYIFRIVLRICLKSHSFMHKTYMMELARRGHQVVVFSPFPHHKQIENYTDVELKTTLPQIMREFGSPNWFDSSEHSSYGTINILWQVGNILCEKIYQHEFIQKLIHCNEEKFDLLVIGAFFNDCVIGLAHRLKIPVIQMCSLVGTKWMDEWVGNPAFYSYIPNTFQEFTSKMTFWQRVSNTLSELYIKMGREVYFLPKQNAIMRKYFNSSEDFPTIQELEKNISLVLVNSHFSVNFPRSVMPNWIEVGGLHIKPPNKLPEDIERYIDESSEGVILFSLGSNVKASLMPEQKRRAFLEAFSRLKQRVLWKWEVDTMPGLPDNVKLGKWLPQSDIL